MNLTVTTTTLGRETLKATLDSVPWGVGVQYHLVVDPRGDEDGAREIWNASGHAEDGEFAVSTTDGARKMRWGERDLIRYKAEGEFLAWMDDDDAYTEYGVETIVQTVGAHGSSDMHIFKAEWPDRVLWKEPSIDYDNMAVPIIVVPNIPKMPLWSPAAAESYYFAAAAEKAVKKAGGKVRWHDEIIARIRPHLDNWKTGEHITSYTPR